MQENSKQDEPPDRGKMKQKKKRWDEEMDITPANMHGNAFCSGDMQNKVHDQQVRNEIQSTFGNILNKRKNNVINTSSGNTATLNSQLEDSEKVKTPVTTDKIKPALFYDQCDKGPFIVYIENKKGNIGKAHLITVGKIVNQSLPKMEHFIKTISSIGLNRVKVEMATANSANALINNDYLKNNNYEAYIPQFLKRRYGVVKFVDTIFSEGELKEAIKPLFGDHFTVVEVRRLNRKVVEGDGQLKYLPSSTIKVTFSGQKIPQKVVIHSVVVEVEPYVQKVVQCMKCLRYGHLNHQCKGTDRCAKCGEPHKTVDCTSTREFCIICKSEDHKANNYKVCPEFKKQKSIKTIMAYENLSYREALKKQNLSYTSAVNKVIQGTGQNDTSSSEVKSTSTKKRRVEQGGNPLIHEHLDILKNTTLENSPVGSYKNIPQYHNQVSNNSAVINSITTYFLQLVGDILQNKNYFSMNDSLLVRIKEQISHILINQ